MKTSLITAFLAAGLCTNAVAADFSSYSTEELLEMRGTVPVDERTDFKTELQSRITVMTPEEKALYNIGNKKGQGTDQAGTMKQEQVQTRTRSSEGEGAQLKTQIREQKRLQDRSQKDQMNQMNQMQQMQQMQQLHQMPRTKDMDTQGKR